MPTNKNYAPVSQATLKKLAREERIARRRIRQECEEFAVYKEALEEQKRKLAQENSPAGITSPVTVVRIYATAHGWAFSVDDRTHLPSVTTGIQQATAWRNALQASVLALQSVPEGAAVLVEVADATLKNPLDLNCLLKWKGENWVRKGKPRADSDLLKALLPLLQVRRVSPVPAPDGPALRDLKVRLQNASFTQRKATVQFGQTTP